MVGGVTTTWGTKIKGPHIRKVENRCVRGSTSSIKRIFACVLTAFTSQTSQCGLLLSHLCSATSPHTLKHRESGQHIHRCSSYLKKSQIFTLTAPCLVLTASWTEARLIWAQSFKERLSTLCWPVDSLWETALTKLTDVGRLSPLWKQGVPNGTNREIARPGGVHL